MLRCGACQGYLQISSAAYVVASAPMARRGLVRLTAPELTSGSGWAVRGEPLRA